MRLFTALALPEAVQDHLDLAVDALRGAPAAGPPAVRWVPAEQRHITTAFFGEVPDGAVPELAARLRDVATAASPMRLRLRGAGVFSRRTLWVGVQEYGEGVVRDADDVARAGELLPGGSRLVELMAACEEAGGAVRPPGREAALRDRRRAHVTIARLGSRRARDQDLSGRAHALSVYEGPPWDARETVLIRSRPGEGRGGGPLYEVVERFSLGIDLR